MNASISAAASILVWGAGAIGGTVGAHLVEAGHEVTFVDRVEDHVAAIRRNGLRITGPIRSMTVNAPAFTPELLEGEWTLVLLAVKAQDTEAAVVEILPHLAPDGCIVSLQNGLCEALIADLAGPERTLGAFVNFGADWIAPGEILFANRAAVVVGELDGTHTHRLEVVLRLLQIFEPEAFATDDIGSYLWGKLGYASLLFAQALGKLGIADCLARPELLPLWQEMAGEVMDVARAEGVSPRGFNGFEPTAFGRSGDPDEAARSVQAMVEFNGPNVKTHSGIWRDLAVRKRRTEIDAQIAPIVALGHRHGIACPRLARLVMMIHEIENGKRAMTDSNLNELMA